MTSKTKYNVWKTKYNLQKTIRLAVYNLYGYDI